MRIEARGGGHFAPLQGHARAGGIRRSCLKSHLQSGRSVLCAGFLGVHLSGKGSSEELWPPLTVACCQRIASGRPTDRIVTVLVVYPIGVPLVHHLTEGELVAGFTKYRRQHPAPRLGPYRRILLSTPCACH